jgi:two-component system sensor histidine kinase DesK
MTDGRTRTARTAADLRWLRGVTAATLWALVLIGGFLQFIIGIDGPPGLRLTVLVASTIASVVLAVALVPLLLRTSVGVSARHPLVVVLIVVAGLTWAIALVPPFAGWAWGFLLAIAGGMLGCLVPRWWSAVVLVCTIGAIALGALSASAGSPAPLGPATPGGGTDLVVAWTLVVMTFMPISAVWVLRLVLRLEDARRTASELAVATERLRFATDLHDIQGHHLQVIALKGELAERRLLAGQPELAAQELADIRTIAQTALEDTRAVVNDYRTVTVAVEARNAAAVLRSAGIDCEARIDAPDLPPSVGAVFAVAIREAATNILRHSRATEASLELIRSTPEEYRLTVTNNGSGAFRTGGTGLAGIAERVAALNGTVESRRRDDTFTLVVRIPAQTTPHRSEAER